MRHTGQVERQKVRLTPIESETLMNSNDMFLQAMQPVVDVFWTLVWSATGSTLSVPRPSAPETINAAAI